MPELSELMNTHVIGDPIAHSMSPIIFDASGVGIRCTRTQVASGHLSTFLGSDEGRASCGFSVTMPLKKEGLELCTWVDEQARAVGAVNTLMYVQADNVAGEPTSGLVEATGDDSGPKEGSSSGSSRALSRNKLHGFNTDVTGIVQAVQEICGAEIRWSEALILGSGATASSALVACQNLAVEHVTICARRSSGADTVFAVADRLGVSVSYVSFDKAAEAITHTQLLISTLPAHAADSIAEELNTLYASSISSTCTERTDALADTAITDSNAVCKEAPSHASHFLRHVAVLDASYTVYPSALTQAVLAGGGTNIPGYEMLIHQGLEQARIFTGKEPDSAAVHCAIEAEIARRTAHLSET